VGSSHSRPAPFVGSRHHPFQGRPILGYLVWQIATSNRHENRPFFGALPRGGWGALGVFEMLCAVLPVVPSAAKWMPILTLLAAAALALESLALAVLYARYSLVVTAVNPLVWVVAGALIAAFVAYGRYTIRPLD
jgi:hypothetical protein